MVEETGKVWPPKPKAPTDGAEDVPTCPHCKRKLLSTRSIMCNWCGAVIGDEEYQQRAAEERAAQDAETKRQVEIEQQETARFGVLGRLKRLKKEGVLTRDPADLLKP